MKSAGLTLLLSMLHLASPQARAVEAPFLQTPPGGDAYWGDGKAEVSLYRASIKRYGILRETEIRHILVREPFLEQQRVKADDWRAPGVINVMKLNQVIRVPTGAYRYDQMHSAFWDAETGRLLKWSLASIDSCGNTYKQAIPRGRLWHYRALTYWEGMEDIDRRLSLPGNVLFYDELPYRLRLIDWERVGSFSAPLISSSIRSKADSLEAPVAAFQVRATDAGWEVTVTHSEGEDRLVFGREVPHPLLAWNQFDGSSLTLIRSTRIAYWEFNAPGDEALLE